MSSNKFNHKLQVYYTKIKPQKSQKTWFVANLVQKNPKPELAGLFLFEIIFGSHKHHLWGFRLAVLLPCPRWFEWKKPCSVRKCLPNAQLDTSISTITLLLSHKFSLSFKWLSFKAPIDIYIYIFCCSGPAQTWSLWIPWLLLAAKYMSVQGEENKQKNRPTQAFRGDFFWWVCGDFLKNIRKIYVENTPTWMSHRCKQKQKVYKGRKKNTHWKMSQCSGGKRWNLLN